MKQASGVSQRMRGILAAGAVLARRSARPAQSTTPPSVASIRTTPNPHAQRPTAAVQSPPHLEAYQLSETAYLLEFGH